MSDPAKKRILVVEDEAIVATDLEVTLDALGYDVVGICATGEEALEASAEAQPDLILMDVRLRGTMDGIETARKINENLSLPLVFLTAYADAETVRRAGLAAAYGYLVKPYNEHDLAPAIETALIRFDLDRSSRSLLRSLEEAFSVLEEGVIALDGNQVVEYLSEVVAMQLGIMPEEAVGKPLTDFLEIDKDTSFSPVGNLHAVGILRPRGRKELELRFKMIALGDGFLVRCRQESSSIAGELASLERRIGYGLESAAVILARELRPRLDELQAAVHLLELPEGVGPPRLELFFRLEESLGGVSAILRRLELGDESGDPGMSSSALSEPIGLAVAECSGLAARRGVDVTLEQNQDLPMVRIDERLFSESIAALLEDMLDRARRGDGIRIKASGGAEPGDRARVAIRRYPGAQSAKARGLRIVPERILGGFGLDWACRMIERFGGSTQTEVDGEGNETIVIELVSAESLK